MAATVLLLCWAGLFVAMLLFAAKRNFPLVTFATGCFVVWTWTIVTLGVFDVLQTLVSSPKVLLLGAVVAFAGLGWMVFTHSDKPKSVARRKTTAGKD